MADKTKGNDSPQNTDKKEQKSRPGRFRESFDKWRHYKNEEYERLIQKESISRMIIKFFLPFWLAILFAFFLYVLFPDDIGTLGGLFVVYFFSPLGMEFGVPIGIGFGLSPYLVIAFMLIIDALAAMFLIWNLSYARMIPLIGRAIKYFEEKGSKALSKYKWIDRLAFIGLIMFVMIPLYGTGSILGSLVGKLMGMDPWKNFVAIIIGSSIRLSLAALVTVGAIKFFF